MSEYIFALHSIKSEGSSSKPESQDVEKNKKPLFEVKERFFDEQKGNRVTHPIAYLPLACERLCPLLYGFLSLFICAHPCLRPQSLPRSALIRGTCLRIPPAFYHWIESFQCRLCSSFNPAYPDPDDAFPTPERGPGQ